MQTRPVKDFEHWKRLIFCLTIIVLPTFGAKAQTTPPVGISVGYFGPIPFEPGFRIGFHMPIATYDNSALMLNINTGYFFRNRDNSNMLLGAELGWRLNKEESRNINTFSIGTNYVMQWEVTGFTVNLQGETTARQRELRHQFMPTFNYEYARRIGEHWAPYFKLGYGHKFTTNAPNSGVALWEFGTRYSFK